MWIFGFLILAFIAFCNGDNSGIILIGKVAIVLFIVYVVGLIVA